MELVYVNFIGIAKIRALPPSPINLSFSLQTYLTLIVLKIKGLSFTDALGAGNDKFLSKNYLVKSLFIGLAL